MFCLHPLHTRITAVHNLLASIDLFVLIEHDVDIVAQGAQVVTMSKCTQIPKGLLASFALISSCTAWYWVYGSPSTDTLWINKWMINRFCIPGYSKPHDNGNKGANVEEDGWYALLFRISVPENWEMSLRVSVYRNNLSISFDFILKFFKILKEFSWIMTIWLIIWEAESKTINMCGQNV